MEETFQLRELFNEKLVTRLAEKIHHTWSDFPRDNFIEEIMARLDDLIFGDRSSLIADALKKYLPPSFNEAIRILVASLGPEAEEEEISGSEGFDVMPQCLFVRRYGLADYETSIHALYEMTKRFTAEWDIRVFIEKYPEKTMSFLHDLTQDQSPFARRLASEGTRPRLPLGSRLQQFIDDPAPVIEILEKLKEDPNLMVRRSVANNLNDISKDNPEIVVDTLKRWKRLKNEGTQWLISHALRTLLKQGHPDALKIMGYDPDVKIRLSDWNWSTETVKLGEKLVFQFELHSEEKQECSVMIDYVIHFMKANGKPAPKVFKASKKTLKPGESLHIEKAHSFKEISTRKHYPGRHEIEIQINGQRLLKKNFVLET